MSQPCAENATFSYMACYTHTRLSCSAAWQWKKLKRSRLPLRETSEDADSLGDASSQPDTVSIASRTSQNTADSDKVTHRRLLGVFFSSRGVCRPASWPHSWQKWWVGCFCNVCVCVREFPLFIVRCSPEAFTCSLLSWRGRFDLCPSVFNCTCCYLAEVTVRRWPLTPR